MWWHSRAVQLAGMRSLRAAYGRCAVVPVVARIRDVLDVKADPAQPDRWVPWLALLALRAEASGVRDLADHDGERLWACDLSFLPPGR